MAARAAGGRGRDGAGAGGDERVLGRGGGRVAGAAVRDVGGQRHVADARHRGVERLARAVEGEADLAPVLVGRRGGEHGFPLRLENQGLALGEALGGADEGAPAVRGVAPVQRHLDAGGIAAAAAQAGEAGRHDARVVDHQGVAGPQQRRQIAHDAVAEGRVRPGVDRQQAGGIARVRRPQRDGGVRQGEIEGVDQHGGGLRGAPAPGRRAGARARRVSRSWRS